MSTVAPPPPPSAPVVDFRQMMMKIQAATRGGTLTAEQVNAALASVGLKPDEIGQLINNALLIASVNAAVDASIASNPAPVAKVLVTKKPTPPPPTVPAGPPSAVTDDKISPTISPPTPGAVVPALPTLMNVADNGLIRTDLRFVPIADEENVRLLLESPVTNLQGIVRFNEFSGELILVRPITGDADLVSERGLPRPWTDTDTATLQTYIQKRFIPKIARDKIDAIVSMHARQRNAFHPVRDYLQALKWDGTPRLNNWLRDYMTRGNTQPPEYLAAVGAAWMISAVARIMEPGCQADYALVFEGDQGTRKSSALRGLAGGAEYFSDSLPADLAHKDAKDHLRGKWIVELPDLAQFKRTEIETVKAFLTRRDENYRPAYGRHEVRFPRQCIFAGSTNEETYLVDPTGNRRFWVVGNCHVNLVAIKRDRDQLWAETVTRYLAGEAWYLTTDELESLARTEAGERVAHDPWTSQVAEITATRLPGPDVSPGEVMEHMNLPTTERHARNAGRVGTVLTSIGWKRGKRHNTRGQLYVRAGLPVPPSYYLPREE
jgi:predicted P-loop ATPase